MRAPASTSHRFLVLDGMRGAAALLVITDHVPSTFADLFPARALAVDFFFILSGFVLAHAYAKRLSSGMSAAQFMIQRLIRLYPLYLLGVVIGAAYALVGMAKGWTSVTPGAFAVTASTAAMFAPTPPVFDTLDPLLYPLDGPAWSLFFELVANVAFASIALLRRETALRIYLPLAALALIALNLHYGRSDIGFLWSSFSGGFARIGFGYFVGVMLYRIWLKGGVPALPAWAAFASLFVIVAAAGLTDGGARLLYDTVVQLILFPALVLLAAGAQVTGLAARVCAALGALSYGVYILHEPLLRFWDLAVATVFGAPAPGSLNVVFIAVIALVASAIAGRIYDEPARAWLKRRLLRPQSERA